MKSYKEYEKVNIGDSDIASLTVVGFDNVKFNWISNELKFGEDGEYKAYLVDQYAEIGNHYKKVMTFRDFIMIYDDMGLCFELDANIINIYRAGLRGCIIQCIN